VFADLSNEKCLEKCCEFSRLGWQLPSPVANFVKVENRCGAAVRVSRGRELGRFVAPPLAHACGPAP
jgi:hypothetical protein